MQLFRTKYDDQKLETVARNALEADPMLDHATLLVSSKKGVLTLTGVAHRGSERDRIEGVVRSALTKAGVKFERLDNQIRVT